MILCRCTKYHPNRTIRSRVITFQRFSRWRPQRRKSTSGFHFGDALQLRTSESICTLNVDNVAQSVADILLLLVSKNKRPPHWNSTSGFYFMTFSTLSACDSASVYQISSKSDHQWPNYNVLAIFKMATTASQIYFRFLLWWRIAVKNVKIYMQTKGDNLRPRYCNFCFLKTNGQPYLNSTSGSFHFHIIVVTGMWYGVGVTIFIQIEVTDR